MRRASLLVLALLGGCAPGGEPAAAPGSESSYDWRRDDRLAYLDARCPGKGRFDEDTSDLLPVLVLKLQSAQRDVLRNVREELALGGVPALEELDRLVRRVATDPHGSPVLLNALAVARNSEATTSEVGRSLVRFCLGHPQETVRTAAVRVLKVHPVPEAYDDLMALLAVAAPAARQDFVPALVRSDPRRFEEQLAGWIEAREEQDLWQVGAQLVAAGADGQTARRLAPLVAQVDAPAVRAYLAATADHTRDPGSLALLEAMLGEEDPTLRGHALSALEFTTATELIASAIDDESAGLRVQAAGLLSRRLEEEVALEALRRALFDPEEKVREVALGALLEVADPAAVDTVVAGWGGDLLELGIASRAVLDRWDRVEGLADRAADLLMDRLAERAGEPLARREALIQALAQVPGPRSTTWLLEHARSEEGTVAGFDLVVEVNTIQALEPDRRPETMAAITELCGPHGHVLVVCRHTTDPVNLDDGPPWPLRHLRRRRQSAKIGENRRTSTKIHEHRRTLMRINENQRKSMNILGNVGKPGKNLRNAAKIREIP